MFKQGCILTANIKLVLIENGKLIILTEIKLLNYKVPRKDDKLNLSNVPSHSKYHVPFSFFEFHKKLATEVRMLSRSRVPNSSRICGIYRNNRDSSITSDYL